MRFMGLDYGTKRIGVAISDTGCTMAHPLEVIEVKGDGSSMSRIKEIASSYGITHVVVGLPYNMDGSIGDIARQVMKWSEELEAFLGLPVVLWDERLTSFEAEGMMIDFNVKARKRRQVIDKIAAGIMLKSYLDSLGQ